MPRNYKKEYKNYQSSTKQKKRRASRNTARNRALAKGIVKKGDKKDMSHTRGGSLILEAQKRNRARNRGKK